MLRIAICDDDELLRQYIKTVVYRKLHVWADLYESGEELLSAGKNYDMLFLDICLEAQEDSHRMNGMEAAKRVRERFNTIIIFVTALPDYVYEAYDVEAFHYLLKPIDEEKLDDVIGRAAAKAEGKSLTQPLIIKTNGKYMRIPIEDIFYGESNGRKILLHTKKGIFSYYEKMEVLEQKLGENFFRSHRGYVVHLQEVAGYDRTSILLKCGDTVFLAKQKYNDFVAVYMNYLTKQSYWR